MEKIIGLDLGSVTCGVAISETGIVARALTTIRFAPDDYDECFDKLLDLLEEHHVKTIVLGLPKHMNGDVGVRGQLSIEFGAELEKEGYHVHLWDERLTTVNFAELFRQTKRGHLILRIFLERKKNYVRFKQLICQRRKWK